MSERAPDMNAHSAIDLSAATPVLARGEFAAATPCHEVEETHWGYIVRSTEATPIALVAAQVASWGIGVSLVVAAGAMWVMPAGPGRAEAPGMSIALSVLMLGVGALCLWYASRGVTSELQVDTKLGEVREVVRNRAGRPTPIGRYGFDAIGGVYIDVAAKGARRERDARGALVLRYRNTAQTLHVARGDLGTLAPLRDRIGRDLLVMRAHTGPRPDFAIAAE